MVSLNSLKNYGGIQLRDIHRGEDLCIPFDLYNFSGTLQDKKHRLRLLKVIREAKKSGR